MTWFQRKKIEIHCPSHRDYKHVHSAKINKNEMNTTIQRQLSELKIVQF